jgi:hypothetical protein
VIHRTFRSLDDAPKLVGFTVKQWATLILGAGLVLGVIHLAHVPTKPAISLCVFVLGLPAALTYVSESGGLQLGVLLREMWRWRWGAHTLPAASPRDQRARGLQVLAADGDSKGERLALGEGVGVEDMAFWERWG